MKLTKRQMGMIYLTPWIIGILVFKLVPFVSTLVLSFADYDLISAPRFIGFQNYIKIFTQDIKFITSLIVTFKYVFLTVPIKLAFALFIAYILNFKLKGVNFFRTAYYIPSILGGNVAIAVLWRFLFADTGLINVLTEKIGLGTVSWLGDPGTALFTLTLLRVWQFGSAMVIFLAALKNIPETLYEAAQIDGASKMKMFFSITIPLLTPVIFFNFIMQLVQAFQEFNGPYIITNGGPLNSTYLYSLLIYDNSFKYFSMGYGSALSWILFIIILIFTALTFKTSKHWVYYSDGEA